MDNFRREFLSFAIDAGVIRFGEFMTKAGRKSPYFFNAGLFSDGASLHRLCQFYADAVIAADFKPDVIFGPAYKGIVLAAGLAMALSERGINLPFCYNRKEAKDHGEGGKLVGAPLKGRVLIIDDVISAGTSVRESVQLILEAGASPYGVITALDRMERGTGHLSATQEVQESYGLNVTSIASLDNLVTLLEDKPSLKGHLEAVKAYREQYGVSPRQ